MTESNKPATMTLADALTRVSCTPDEAAVFLQAIASQVAEIHTDFRKSMLQAAADLAYAPVATGAPAEHERGRSHITTTAA
jgi:hypothetical protein